MEPHSHRTERISEALREELGELIEYEMSDPRVMGVVVTDVQVSPDKRHAHVLLGFTSDAGNADAAIEALIGARPFLRRELAQRLDIFRIPDLHFRPDISADLGNRMSHLLKRIRKGRPRGEE